MEVRYVFTRLDSQDSHGIWSTSVNASVAVLLGHEQVTGFLLMHARLFPRTTREERNSLSLATA